MAQVLPFKSSSGRVYCEARDRNEDPGVGDESFEVLVESQVCDLLQALKRER